LLISAVWPLALLAGARATLLKAPRWPSLPISWIGRSPAARSSAARRVVCASSGWLPLEKVHCVTFTHWPGARCKPVTQAFPKSLIPASDLAWLVRSQLSTSTMASGWIWASIRPGSPRAPATSTTLAAGPASLIAPATSLT
jgi:hypothetical protein